MQTTRRHKHFLSARKLAAMLTMGFVLVAAPPAHAAGNPTAADSQYGAVLGGQSGGGAPGGLPFTGINLVTVAGLGVGLAAAGFGLRSASRRSRQN
jgi:hypothetical protein